MQVSDAFNHTGKVLHRFVSVAMDEGVVMDLVAMRLVTNAPIAQVPACRLSVGDVESFDSKPNRDNAQVIGTRVVQVDRDDRPVITTHRSPSNIQFRVWPSS